MICRQCKNDFPDDQIPRSFYATQKVDANVCNPCRRDDAVEFSGVDPGDERDFEEDISDIEDVLR